MEFPALYYIFTLCSLDTKKLPSMVEMGVNFSNYKKMPLQRTILYAFGPKACSCNINVENRSVIWEQLLWGIGTPSLDR